MTISHMVYEIDYRDGFYSANGNVYLFPTLFCINDCNNTTIMNCINLSVKYDSQCGGAAGLVTANAQKSTGSAKKTICCKYKTPIFVYSKK